MAKERKKKYQLIKDTLTDYGRDLIPELMADYNNSRKYVSRKYTLTTSGGRSCLWKVNTKEEYVTVSTETLRYEKVNNWLKVPVYEHYVLTKEGFQYVRGLIVELGI